MKILCIAGTQLRHQYFLSKIVQHFDIAGIILFKRRIVQPPKIAQHLILKSDLEFEKAHLERLKSKEHQYFSDAVDRLDLSGMNVRQVSNKQELNDFPMLDWIKSLRCDVMIDYGSGILSDDFIKALPEWKINLHGGLSPYFKGSATLLWPFYFQQPELAGITYHMISSKIDGGDILQHFRPRMYPDDIASDIGCRAIAEGSDVAVKLLEKLQNTGKLEKFPQKHSGKLFLEKDYHPAILKVIYRYFEQGLIKNYLDNKSYFDNRYEFIDQVGVDR